MQLIAVIYYSEKVIVGACCLSNLLAQTDNTLKGSRHRLKNLPRSEGANPSDKRVKTASLRGRAVSSAEMVKVQEHVAFSKTNALPQSQGKGL